MYGKGKVTNDPKQAAKWMRMVQMNGYRWRQRTRAGLEVLKNDPNTDPNRIAAIGYSFGGTTVQQLAYSGADIKGVVSFYGSPLPPIPNLAIKVKAKIMLLHAGADSYVETGELERYIADLGKSGLDWRLMIYGGAKHGFSNPDTDKAGMDDQKYNRAADLHSWVLMKMFFDEIFAPE
jgi:dienelactone hydrolase